MVNEIFITVRTASLIKLSNKLNLKEKNKFDRIKRQPWPAERYHYQQVCRKNKERKINEDPCTDLRILPPTSRRRKGRKLLHTVKYFSSLSICLLVTAWMFIFKTIIWCYIGTFILNYFQCNITRTCTILLLMWLMDINYWYIHLTWVHFRFLCEYMLVLISLLYSGQADLNGSLPV